MTSNERKATLNAMPARAYRARALWAANSLDIWCDDLEELATAYVLDAPDILPAGSHRGMVGHKPIARHTLRSLG